MKIRIRGNHLRFRLRQQDVAALFSNGSVCEKIEFGTMPDEQISFILERSDVKSLIVVFRHNIVRVSVPGHILDEWMHTGMVGFEKEVITGNKRIGILVEKDFACLDANEEDNIGAYPNPAADCAK